MAGAVEVTALDTEHDWDHIVLFHTRNIFPFHLNVSPTRQSVERRIEAGHFSPPENAAYWITEGGEKSGIAVLSETRDPSALIDLRLRESSRGFGLGSRALGKLADKAFSSHEHIRRLEGATRDDNIAMQRAFLKAGWVKESHYREAGPEINGVRHDILGYSLTRNDWHTGETHPPAWTMGLSLH